MERRYREVTLRRRGHLKKIFTVVMAVFVLWSFFAFRSSDIWKDIWKIGTNCVTPSIFRYEDRKVEKSDAPFFLWLLFPKIFAYTWQETLPVFQVIEVSEKSETEKSIEIVLNQENGLSLLQENIYTSNSYASETEGRELTSDVVSALRTESLSVMNKIPISNYHNMTELIKDYYIIDASTSPDSSLLDAEYMYSYDCTIDKNTEGAQILIYHSHSQEGFADSIAGDVNTTIVGAGTRLATLLEQEYGFKVLHHTGVYDVPSRDNAYGNALPQIEQILEENPSIQVVIDLHRDAVNEKTKLVKTIDGKDYAKFMFFNGICRSTNGAITYLNNPYLKENLAFSFQAQTIAEGYFPGITRKIYLKAWRYNMHLRPRNMLIELGAQTNTVEEVMNTCDILAFVLNEVLSGQ